MRSPSRPSLFRLLAAAVSGALRGAAAAVRELRRPLRAKRPAAALKERADPHAADCRRLHLALARDLDRSTLLGPAWKVYAFADLVALCRSARAFAQLIDGRTTGTPGNLQFIASPETRSSLGKVLAKEFAGLVVDLPERRRLRLDQRGRHRHRRFTAELLQ